MRQVDKLWKAGQLFDAMGEIEDRWIAEAETPYAHARGIRLGRRGLIVAVTLSLVAVSTLGIMVANRSKDAAPEEMVPPVEIETDASYTLSERMSRLKGQTTTLRVSREELNLFSGIPQVIWKYRDESEYRAKNLTHGQVDQLMSAMELNPGTEVDANHVKGELEGIWLVDRDGMVISPCLKSSDGNVGYGELFAYEPELEPSDVFVNTLCGIIS